MSITKRWGRALVKTYSKDFRMPDKLLACALNVVLQPEEHPQKLAVLCQYMAETWDQYER